MAAEAKTAAFIHVTRMHTARAEAAHAERSRAHGGVYL